jgi:hypothetical protein
MYIPDVSPDKVVHCPSSYNVPIGRLLTSCMLKPGMEYDGAKVIFEIQAAHGKFCTIGTAAELPLDAPPEFPEDPGPGLDGLPWPDWELVPKHDC